jgi:hypothetical protein
MAKGPAFPALTLFVLVALFATNGVYGQGPAPSAKISIESNSIALAVGVNWGDGRLIFRGKRQLFSVSGLTLVDIGIAKASAVGEVYNLTDVSKFEGTYLAGEAGFALAGGMGGIAMSNQNGVILHLRGDSEEALLQLAPSGVTIKLKK